MPSVTPKVFCFVVCCVFEKWKKGGCSVLLCVRFCFVVARCRTASPTATHSPPCTGGPRQAVPSCAPFPATPTQLPSSIPLSLPSPPRSPHNPRSHTPQSHTHNSLASAFDTAACVRPCPFAQRGGPSPTCHVPTCPSLLHHHHRTHIPTPPTRRASGLFCVRPRPFVFCALVLSLCIFICWTWHPVPLPCALLISMPALRLGLLMTDVETAGLVTRQHPHPALTHSKLPKHSTHQSHAASSKTTAPPPPPPPCPPGAQPRIPLFYAGYANAQVSPSFIHQPPPPPPPRCMSHPPTPTPPPPQPQSHRDSRLICSNRHNRTSFLPCSRVALEQQPTHPPTPPTQPKQTTNQTTNHGPLPQRLARRPLGHPGRSRPLLRLLLLHHRYVHSSCFSIYAGEGPFSSSFIHQLTHPSIHPPTHPPQQAAGSLPSAAWALPLLAPANKPSCPLST